MKIDSVSGKDKKYLVYDIKNLKEAKLINLNLEKGKQIIFIFAFSCSVSERALDTIFNDIKASKIFKQYGNIISLDFSPSSLLFVKKHYDFDKLYIAYNEKSFKDFNLNTYPAIYYLKDGNIVDFQYGWDKEGLKKFLKKADKNGMFEEKEYISEQIKERPMPSVSEILFKIPDEEKLRFLESFKIKRAMISSFNYNILTKYYTEEEMIDIYDTFTPF